MTGSLDDPVVRFDDGEISFHHLASWRAQRFESRSLHVHLVTYLSTEDLHDPTTVEHHPDARVTFRSGSPIDRLPPGGVLVSWTELAMLGAGDLSDRHGDPILVDGMQARLEVGVPSRGDPDGAERALTARIPLAGRGSTVLVCRACACGPGLDAFEQQVRAMLGSARIGRARTR